MANARPGYKRIMGEIPEAMHEKITWYNKVSEFPLNVSKAIENCLTRKVDEIEQEAIEYIKVNRGIQWTCNAYYREVLNAIKEGLPVSDVYKIALEEQYINPKERCHRSLAYLPLLPVNRIEHKEEEKKVFFFVDEIVCLVILPLNDDWETPGI